MKKFLLFSLVLFISITVKAQIINFPDANLKAKLLSANTSNGIAGNAAGSNITIDSNSDNEIQFSEALQVHRLSLRNGAISSLVGMENFINLIHFGCDSNAINNITSLNLPNLKSFSCNNNNISSLSGLENLVNLTYLEVGGNPITSLNLSNLSLLQSLYCSNTLLTEIDICGTQVRLLWCSSNPLLTSLKLKNNVITPNQFAFRVNNENEDQQRIPPPLPYFLFDNLPSLNSICYDAGEYTAILEALSWNTAGISFSTSCVNCLPSSIVNLKLHIQGFYNPITNMMNPVKFNQGLSTNIVDVTDISVELRNSSGTLIASTTTNLKTNGTAVCSFTNTPNGSYFIDVKNNNSVRTWSTTPQTIGAIPLTYDFTNSPSKAYGNNLVQLSSGVYGFYSGDSNQDGFIDASDYSEWETNANNFASGNNVTDLNGDGFVDPSDYSIWEENAARFTSIISPFQ